MYCKKCGKQIDDDAVFCQYCGTDNSSTSDVINSETSFNNSYTQLSQPEINKKLCQYKELTEAVICPICGYSGSMGLVKKNVAPMYRRIIAFVCVVLLGEIISQIMNASFFVSLIIYVICFGTINNVFKAKKRKFICPNCDSELFDK